MSFLDSDSDDEVKSKPRQSILDSDSEEDVPAKKKSGFLDSDSEDDAPAKKKKTSILDSDSEEEPNDDEEGTDSSKPKHGYLTAAKSTSSILDSEDEEETTGVKASYLSDSEEESEGEGDDNFGAAGDDQQDSGSSWFLSGTSGEGDEEDTKRRVRSQAEKCYDEMSEIFDQIQDHSIGVDDTNIHRDFEELQRVYAKYENQKGVPYPPKIYLFTLLALEDFVAEVEEGKKNGDDEYKRVSGTKMFTQFAQRLSRNNKNFTEVLAEWRKKRDSGEEDEKPAFEEPGKEGKAKKGKEGEGEEEEEESEEEAEKRGPLTQEMIGKKVAELYALIGKRNVALSKVAAELQRLAARAQAPELQLLINSMHCTVLSNIAQQQRNGSEYLVVGVWNPWRRVLESILNLLEDHDNLSILEDTKNSEETQTDDFEKILINAYNTALDKSELTPEQLAALEAAKTAPYRVSCFFYLSFQRLDEELVRSLTYMDSHRPEYVSRVADEIDFVELEKRALAYYQKKGDKEISAQLAANLIQHVYFRVDKSGSSEGDSVLPQIDEWLKVVFSGEDARLRVRSILGKIYYLAVNGRFFEARDLMLATHIQDVITDVDVPTQILFNRAVTQIGLAAFRQGFFDQAQLSLREIHTELKKKKIGLLGQGESRHLAVANEKMAKEDHENLVPAHIHINTDFVDFAFTVSLMFREVPSSAGHPTDCHDKTKFWSIFQPIESQNVIGPARTSLEHFRVAALALRDADWRKCIEELRLVPAWHFVEIVPGLVDRLVNRLKEESLRAFLFAFGKFYANMRIADLSSRFEISEADVQRIVARMLHNKELDLQIDQPTQTVVPKESEPSTLQSLALKMAEGCKRMTDDNSYILEMRTNPNIPKGFAAGRTEQGQQETVFTGFWKSNTMASKRQGQQYRNGRGGKSMNRDGMKGRTQGGNRKGQGRRNYQGNDSRTGK